MAGKGLIANLRPFKPGHSGNPAGRAGVLPPEIRSQRKKNQAALIQMVSSLLMLTKKEAKKKARDPKRSQLEIATHKLIEQATNYGDLTAYRYLVELMVGKIPEHDYDGFTEEDIRILNRVKEVFAEQQKLEEESSRSGD